jgi:triphosphoribosyl-dephospho-CoA synthase
VRDHAERFLALGGTASAGWRARAIASHHVFIQHRLPGGAADLLAACCLVQAISALDQQ